MKPNHNYMDMTTGTNGLFILCQRYKMKPNHNFQTKNPKRILVVYTMSKIQNETKSQHVFYIYFLVGVVYTMSKIQNETKSQLTLGYPKNEDSCLYYVKDTK